MGAERPRLMWEVMLPAALPQIFTGLQVALPIAMIVEIVTEMAMGGYGIGGAMQTASRFANSRGVFAGIIEIAMVGYALVKADDGTAPPAAGLASGGAASRRRRDFNKSAFESPGDRLGIGSDTSSRCERTRLRKPLLYPAELRDRMENFVSRYFLGTDFVVKHSCVQQIIGAGPPVSSVPAMARKSAIWSLLGTKLTSQRQANVMNDPTADIGASRMFETTTAFGPYRFLSPARYYRSVGR